MLCTFLFFFETKSETIKCLLNATDNKMLLFSQNVCILKYGIDDHELVPDCRIPDCRIPYCRFHFAESHIADFC